MIDRMNSVQGNLLAQGVVVDVQGIAGKLAYSAVRVAAAAHLPAAVWAEEAPKRIVRRRLRAAAPLSVPRIGNRSHLR